MTTTRKAAQTPTSRETRERGVSEAFHSLEMEGLPVTPTSRSDAAEFVSGAINAAEMVTRARLRAGLNPG